MTYYLKIIALLGFVFFFSSVVRAATDDELVQLEAEMLKCMEGKDRARLFSVTNQLKSDSKEAGNERLFYRAWGNQAIYDAAHQNYESAFVIVKSLKDYAAQEGSIYGEYAGLHTEAMILLQQQDYEAAENAFLVSTNFRHRHYPNESAAVDLRELLKIAYIRHDTEMAKNYANQILAEPNLEPHHKGRTLSRLSVIAFEENDLDEFNHIYAEMERLTKTHHIQTINLYTEVNYHIINGDYDQALLLVDRLSADTCAERKALIYHRLGDNDKAYNYMVRYKHISDSIANASHDNSMANLYLRMNNDRLRLEQDLLAHQNSQLRYRFYFALALLLILLLLFMIYKRRKLIKLLKRDNSLLDTGKKGAERALKDLNELSFYESKSFLPLTIPVRVNMLCDHLTTLTQSHCEKGVVTIFQTDFPDDYEITTNPDALEKLLAHLLNSSADFTRKGTILLRCTESGDQVLFSVTDSSSVLSEKSKNRISDIFTDDEYTVRYVSMNFNICQSISRLLHGRIWHDTEYTQGTRFCFEVPKAASSDVFTQLSS